MNRIYMDVSSLTILAFPVSAAIAILRYRVWDIIDRRFYRQKYNAEQAVATFAAAARSETA